MHNQRFPNRYTTNHPQQYQQQYQQRYPSLSQNNPFNRNSRSVQRPTNNNQTNNWNYYNVNNDYAYSNTQQHNHQNNNNNNNNKKSNNKNKQFQRTSKSQVSPSIRKTKSKTKAKIKRKNNNENKNSNDSKSENKKHKSPKKIAKQAQQDEIPAELLGFSSDDEVMEQIMAMPVTNRENNDEKEECMNDDDMNMNKNNKEMNKFKSNIDRKNLNFDRATKSWYDKTCKYYIVKKLFNEIASNTRINTSEMPKIIIKNIDICRWSYGDVHASLDAFIEKMKELDNEFWERLSSMDIIEYKIHIPKDFIPDNENDEKDNEMGMDNENKEDEFDYVNNSRKKEDWDKWLKTLMQPDKDNNKDNKQEKRKQKKQPDFHPWYYGSNRKCDTQSFHKRWYKWNPDLYCKKTQIINDILTNVQTINNNNEKTKCALLKKAKKRDRNGRIIEIGMNYDYLFEPMLPLINSSGIKARGKKQRHVPSIIPMGKKFNVPKFGYSEYKQDNDGNWHKDYNVNQSTLNFIPHMELVLNPNGNFIRSTKDWSKKLMKNFDRYNGNDFGEKISIGFFQSFQY